jgi:hypothetical protein
MPGIVLHDYTRGDYIVEETRNHLAVMVHEIIREFTDKWSKHSTVAYAPAGHLDVSCYPMEDGNVDSKGFDYVLVVDGEKNKKTKKHKDAIRKAIKEEAARILNLDPSQIAVRYRLFNSSFG